MNTGIRATDLGHATAAGPQRVSQPAGAVANRLKVLLLVTELEDYTVAFANGLSRHASVVVGVPKRQFARMTEWFEPAVDLRLLDWPRHRSLSNPRFLLSLTSLIRRERPDVVHLLSHSALWLNLALPFWRPIPLVSTVHDVDRHPGDDETGVLPDWAPTLIVRQSGDIVVHGEGLRERAIARYGKAPGCVHVLSHPPILRYPELARREGLQRRTDDCFTVLMFGRIMAYKGLEQLIRAEAALAKRISNLRVVIAGRGDDPWQFRELMGDPNRYDIRNRFIEDREAAQLFMDADVVALPYVEASQSGVLNIATAFGRPVVVSDVGEFRATVETRGIGIVIPPGDPVRLADAIERLAVTPSLLAECAAQARGWVEGANAPEAIGDAANALYRSIIARNSRKASG